ncbi:YwqJ-related putative deaminase [Embleya sp. AB8]|uniref:YwqJ-related putative deaminase n=1 Tax=Embleya sp. AB8 TaxID=3156304 RepID=UPI003C713DDF
MPTIASSSKPPWRPPAPAAPGAKTVTTPQSLESAATRMDAASKRIVDAQNTLQKETAGTNPFGNDPYSAKLKPQYETVVTTHQRGTANAPTLVTKTGTGLRKNTQRTTTNDNTQADNFRKTPTGPTANKTAAGGQAKPPQSSGKAGASRPGISTSGPTSGQSRSPAGPSGAGSAGSGGRGGGGGRPAGPGSGDFRRYDRPGPEGNPPIRRTQGPTGRGATGYEGRTTTLGPNQPSQVERDSIMREASQQLANDTREAVAQDPQVGKRTRPTMAGAFEHDGVVTSHTSVRRGEVDIHPALRELYDRVPEAERAIGHGRCAEVPLLSDRLQAIEAQRRGLPPLTPEEARDYLSGGRLTTHAINYENDPALAPHGSYVPACRSCARVIDYLGITHVPTGV